MIFTSFGRRSAIAAVSLATVASMLAGSPPASAATKKAPAKIGLHVDHHSLPVGTKDRVTVKVSPHKAHIFVQQLVRGKWRPAITPAHNTTGVYNFHVVSKIARENAYRIVVSATKTSRQTTSGKILVTWFTPPPPAPPAPPAPPPVVAPTTHILTQSDTVASDNNDDERTTFGDSSQVNEIAYPFSVEYAWDDSETRGNDAFSTFGLNRSWNSFSTVLGVSDHSITGRPAFIEVLADGRSLGKYRVVSGTSVPLDLDVSGVSRLTIDVVVDTGIAVVLGTPTVSSAAAPTPAGPARSTVWLDDQSETASDSNEDEHDSQHQMAVVGGIFYAHAETFRFDECNTNRSDTCQDAFEEWDLTKRFTQLTGQVALDDSSVLGSANVLVTLDGVTVAEGVVSGGAPFPVNVTVTNGARLRITVHPQLGPLSLAFVDGRLS